MSPTQLVSPSEMSILSQGAAADGVAPYNFRRPDRVSREQIHSLHYLHDRFARSAGTSLSAYLRAVLEISLTTVEQRTYAEFVSKLADPTAFYALAVPPFAELGALEIHPNVAFAVIDRMLGGGGQGLALPRALTEIEQHVVDSVVKVLLEGLTETWKPVVELAFGIRGRETRPQLLKVAAPNEVIIMLTFEVRLNDTRGTIHLCLPEALVEATSSQVAQAWQRHRRELTLDERGWLTRSLERVPVALVPEIVTTLPAADIAALAVGDVIELGVPADRPVDLRVGGVPKLRAHLTTDRGRLMARIERRHGDAAGNAGEDAA
jgi:flagellar motor switch protein FliM